MIQPQFFQKLAIYGIAGAIGAIGIQASAQANQMITVPRGEFAPDIYAVFGDTATVIPPCALCDSTVSSTAYRTLGDDDWRDDPAIVARGLANPLDSLPGNPGSSGIDLAAEWVFFYQVVNTNPLTAGETHLEDFNVTKTDKFGNPVAEQPYTSGGYYDRLVFANASTDTLPLDVPNNWEAEPIALGNAITNRPLHNLIKLQ